MFLTRKIEIVVVSFVVLLVGILWYNTYNPISLPIAREGKMTIEIEKIRTRDYTKQLCVQYALVATRSGNYPCYNGETTFIFLNMGEIWKYGKTCNGEEGRYPNGLPVNGLRFVPQFFGTEEQCLIVEKQKIYNYFLLPENIERAKKNGTQILIRPPGNKIDR